MAGIRLFRRDVNKRIYRRRVRDGRPGEPGLDHVLLRG